ncbi:helix-turn-helix domain-containing protein [Oxalobacteraceae bacterium A2-2]
MLQIKELIKRRAITMVRLAELIGMARPNLVTVLSGRHDSRASTLEGLAAALEAEWVLVPKEHLAEVRRVVEGHGSGPDWTAKSAVELFLERSK